MKETIEEVWLNVTKNIRFPENKKEKANLEVSNISININEVDPILLNPQLENIDQIKKYHNNKRLDKYSLSMLTFLKNSKINLEGKNGLLPCLSVENSKLNKNIQNKFINDLKHGSFTIIQSVAIPNILTGRNFVGISSTGSGKTLAYLLPICQKLIDNPKSKALIVVPTFELSVQIFKVCMQFIGRKDALNNLKFSHIQKMDQELNNYQLVITTPNKIVSEFENNPQYQSLFDIIVLDEADKFFELSLMGILDSLLTKFKSNSCQWILISATLPLEVERSIRSVFVDKVQCIIGAKIACLDKIDQKLIYCGNEEGKINELQNLINNGELGLPCLIFLQDKLRVKQVYRFLQKIGIKSNYLSGELSLEEREQRLKSFEDEKVWIMVTTEVLSRGIDLKNLKSVINYDIPTSKVSYIHRIGRTGRAGKKGKAFTFFTNEDKPLLRNLAVLLQESGCDTQEWMLNMEKTSKSDLKKLEKRPIYREGIDQRPQVDFNFKMEMKKKDDKFISQQIENDQLDYEE